MIDPVSVPCADQKNRYAVERHFRIVVKDGQRASGVFTEQKRTEAEQQTQDAAFPWFRIEQSEDERKNKIDHPDQRNKPKGIVFGEPEGNQRQIEGKPKESL